MARNKTTAKNIHTIPQSPGVYFLKNKQGEIFYIGKSNNLLSRLKTHTSTESFKGIEHIHTIEWIKTANEIEALLREREYIQHYKPRLNADLKDGKQYLYIGITKEDYPRIYTTHQPRTQKRGSVTSEYIGPFTDAGAIRRVLKMLRHSFPYYTATAKQSAFPRKHSAIPCPYCHLNLCPGPAPNKTEYRRTVTAIKNIMMGKNKHVRRNLEKQMRSASQKNDFETAAKIRDQLSGLNTIFIHHRNAQTWNKKNPRDHTEMGLYLSHLLKTELPIQTIEGYDISNIQGTESVASMVRFENGKPHKALYRSFNIRLPQQPNDFLMLREALRRRFAHTEWSYPDLILIDGGKGQLSSALTELRHHNITIPVVSLAKKLEELYIPGHPEPLLLSIIPQQVELLLRYVRDEAHRFAITKHRARHRKIFQP